MQHTRVAFYQLKPGTADEVIRRAEAGAFPFYRSQPGFVAYGLVKRGEDSVISISVWQSEEQATAAVQANLSRVRDYIGEMVVSVENYVGDLAFFSSTGTLGS